MSEKSGVRQRKRVEELKSEETSSSQGSDKPWDQRFKKRPPTCWEQYGKYFWMLLLFEFILLVVGIIVVLSMESPIKPRRIQFPTARPLEGALAPNTILQNAKRLFEGEVIGPESLVLLDGKIYTGTYDGRIVSIEDDKKITTIARLGREPCGAPEYEHTCGRPLGIHVSEHGTLYVMDGYLGLFEVNLTGEYELLVPSSRSYLGHPVQLGNDVTRVPDGDFFFTDSDFKWQRRDFPYSVMELSPNGRLMWFNPTSRFSNVALLDLYFPNGILLSPDNDFLLICESTAFRILKYYIRGEKSGDKEIFVDNLPGLPDNIRPSSSGGYWVGIHFTHLRTGSVPILNFLAERPMLRKQLMKVNGSREFWDGFLLYHLKGDKAGQKEVFIGNLPKVPDNIRPSRNGGYWVALGPGPVRQEESWFPFPEWLGARPWFRKQLVKIVRPHFLLQFLPKYGMVIELNKDGEIINSLHDPTGEVIDSVSEVLDTGDALYFGSFNSPFLAKLDYKSKPGKEKLIRS
ncbi:Adipocyte plasma membrane-associated protein [Holothuria leucospilota]|uniref:Adipocyte plasma membrane-associated protein n=1 Tax=Holothuria leucospilota TaxID=206669 RepID=A0A9Q1HHR0_HOLLE|nr:Adipocyte plasma membrane-associated protein [Holothuria leucospilota]